ncbi:TPA: flagellar motor protein MotA [Candidatus Edwardsbacteria bacterium]|nr:flagellar motor protein MotA [Candidatus Edwardsbacteria bacterium]HBZ86412.1 flagellar motor protein MotA [Candidatus Edwardsbacteria bacterium]
MLNGLMNAPMIVKILIMGVVPAIVAAGLGIALARTKKIGLVTLILYVIGLAVSFVIYKTLPEYIQAGGPVVIILVFLLVLLFTYIIERSLTIGRARGAKNLTVFMEEFRELLRAGNVTGAIAACNAQRGSTANVLRAGLEKYLALQNENLTPDKKSAELLRAIEEANMLETPLLERNLIMLTTIASIGTMVGLLGTTLGMIRAFQAMAHAGAPDASELARGISEALINTAGGLFNGIGGIVANNYFMNKVSLFQFGTDEAIYEMQQLLTIGEK